MEWPTLVLVGMVHLAWASLLWLSHLIGPGVAVLILAPGLVALLVLHSSLQHEVVHGHPFRHQRLNDLLVSLPLGLLHPYGRFAALHRAHHATPHLTDPLDDPESHYLTASAWQRSPAWLRQVRRANQCLAGRMLIGPVLSTGALIAADAKAIAGGNRRILLDWTVHLILSAAVLVVVARFSTIPAWLYITCCWAALSILSIRTFLEHKADGPLPARSVIIDSGGLLGFLFLNNHLHAVHHARPRVAWYRLPRLYRRQRHRFLRSNGGYAYAGYGAIFQRYLLTGKEPVTHPGDTGRTARPASRSTLQQ